VDLLDIEVDTTAAPTAAGDGADVGVVERPETDEQWPYAGGFGEPSSRPSPKELRLIPYHRWAERGPSTMRVWLPERRP
jgi:DUF1680 family protein